MKRIIVFFTMWNKKSEKFKTVQNNFKFINLINDINIV